MPSARSRTPGQHAADALRSLRVLIAALTKSARTLEEGSGVTNAQLFLLRQLATRDSLSVNELAERARTRQNTVSSVVGRLAREGLVDNIRSAADARRAEVSLTPKGRRLLAKAPTPPTEALIDGLDALAPRDARNLSSGLRALLDVLELEQEDDPMLFEDGRE